MRRAAIILCLLPLACQAPMQFGTKDGPAFVATTQPGPMIQVGPTSRPFMVVQVGPSKSEPLAPLVWLAGEMLAGIVLAGIVLHNLWRDVPALARYVIQGRKRR